MKLPPTKTILVLVTVLGSSSRALAAGDPAAGQKVFATHCATCHATEAGQNKIGPSLAGIVGSKSGTVPGFDFSPAMKNADITWDDAQGHVIVTIEGLSADGTHPVQLAWEANNVPQCGYCQAGQIMQTAALIKQTPKPSDQQIVDAMSGNICRCGTYLRIRQAIKSAAESVG